MNKKTRSTKSEKWRHTCNSVEIAWTNEQKVAVTSYGRNKNHDDEIKNIAGQVLTYNSKNFHWLNRKTRPRMDDERIEKTILKKNQNKKIRNKQKINVKMLHVNKKTTSEKWKFNSNKKLGLEWAVNWLGKPLKKFYPKNRKNSKNQNQIAACEQKSTTEKPNFCSNTVFSLYFKIRVHAAKPLAFSLHFLFRRDQNNYSNLTSKIMKMCEQILKKKTAPQNNSNSLNCKKTKRRPIIAPAIAVRLLIKQTRKNYR